MIKKKEEMINSLKTSMTFIKRRLEKGERGIKKAQQQRWKGGLSPRG